MKIIKADKKTISRAVKVLKKGGVIVYPTETAYGIGADFFNPKAVKKVYQIKGRQFKKQLSVIVSNMQLAKKIVKFNAVSLKLAKKHWPGPLTLVLQLPTPNFQLLNKIQSPTPKLYTLGLRISSNKLATGIVKKFGGPITATSANFAGKNECYSIDEVVSQFKNRKYQPDLVIDAGKLPKQKPSTVVQVVDGEVKILRKGKINI